MEKMGTGFSMIWDAFNLLDEICLETFERLCLEQWKQKQVCLMQDV